MKKTNIRLRSNFVFEDKNEYFLSSINDIHKWKELKEDEFNKFKEDNITNRLKILMKEYDIYTNVNFYEEDKNNTIKKIELEKKGGGWIHSDDGSDKEDLSGGWSKKIQSGGDWIMNKVMDKVIGMN